MSTITAPSFSPPPPRNCPLLQGNKPRTVRSTNTWPPVLDRLIRDRELAQVEPHHLRLDLNLVELFS